MIVVASFFHKKLIAKYFDNKNFAIIAFLNTNFTLL